jgi:hypothetical protein
VRRLALLVAVAAASGLVLAFPFASSGRDAGPSATIHFSFQGYANNVRVRAPLVGPWQLGVARIHGSGVLGGGDLTGSFVDTDDPLYSRYQPRWLRAKVVGYRYFQAAHGEFTKLTLTVMITRSSHPTDECAPGLTGRLVLYDARAKLSNGEVADYVTLGSWSGKCNTHVHGWTNEDGGARTSPSFGGPPNGGQWAVVRATAS